VTSIDGVAAEYDQRGEFPRVLNGLFPTPVSLATRSRVLADAVVRTLEAMKADGSLKTLFDRYGAALYTDKLEVVGPQ
jgi:polar amino acid transport system substrate-binding protein